MASTSSNESIPISILATKQRILTLTTDFGHRDGYVAAMKGTILAIAPETNIVDITHSISPQDVMEAAHILAGTALYFPADTVHLVVVDPDVGTHRRGIAIEYGHHFYVGPDNGIFSLILKRDVPTCMIELDQPQFWRTENPSLTFHGRDIFAPVAAHIASGKDISLLGSGISEIKAMHWALPISDSQGIQGWVVHVDAFGNCITNITREIFDDLHQDRLFKCYAGNAILHALYPTYADASTGDPVLLFNSDDTLEVAINRGSASEMLDIKKGASVNIVFTDDKEVDGRT